MPDRTLDQAAGVAAGDDRQGYDAPQIALHWLTAALVALLWGIAHAWPYVTRGSPLRHNMQALHVSLGLCLIVVLAARIAWRARQGRRMPAAGPRLLDRAAHGMHYLLYALLIAVACLGVTFRWAQHEPLALFGLFSIPSPVEIAKARANGIGDWHENLANLIFYLAGLHAAAALFHHYVLKDNVLRRMLRPSG